MIKYFPLFILFAIVLFNIFGCNSPTDSETETGPDSVLLKGQVINKQTYGPVVNAIVRLSNYSPATTTFTDSLGKFEIEIELNETTEIVVSAYKESFIIDSVSVLVIPGRAVDVPLLSLSPTSTTPVSSGDAASIILAGITSTSIGVRESGSPESAKLTFEVQDSSGIPVDLEHAVNISFRLGSAPGGGEFLNPLNATTSNNGQVHVDLFSGTIAGPVQIFAEINLSGALIRSKPVPVAIHGGLPDSTHFSLAVEKVNLPGYNIYGLTDFITAFVGDKYANPVKPETAVYFTTTGGIIEGSALTNNLGEASVRLVSASPKPNHPDLGPGFATVYARTADENQVTIETETIVLFSGRPQLSVSPTNVSIPNGSSQTFFYSVSDQNGNPLAEGTSINVIIESGAVKALGDISVNLPDTQSPSWTNFSFTLIDTAPDTLIPNYVSVKINSTGPNGRAKTYVSGTAN